ncbi:hypothetical protein FRC03_012918 [Tulasnella sp. 419]|nr:hypothetical protein FRC03_012918 [Tulasnella sp. 419]
MNEGEESEEEDEEEEDTHLHGFSEDDDEDSSDEDDDDGVAKHAPIEVSKLPTIARDDATVKRKLDQAKKKPSDERGVIYLGRIPHGFYEDQMKEYFTQFGDVTRLRLSRNKKTGKSKHYAFIEFTSASVAQIVSETMDNYLLTGHILTCKVIPKDKLHPKLWIGANKKYKQIPHDRIERVKHNKDRTEEQQKRAEDRLLKRQRLKQDKLAKLGIKYDMEPVGYVSSLGLLSDFGELTTTQYRNERLLRRAFYVGLKRMPHISLQIN